MIYYRYKRISPSGKYSCGTVQLPYRDILSAVTHLEKDGSIILSVKSASWVRRAEARFDRMKVKTRLSRSEQAEMLGNLAVMLRAGITLTAALEEIAIEDLGRSLQADMKDMIFDIKSGALFSEAAHRRPHLFPASVVHLVRIGEETGRLDQMLQNGAEHLRRIDTIFSNTRQALMYPGFVLAAMTFAFIFWIYFVAPKILDLFREMALDLPLLTVWIMAASAFVKQFFWMLAGGSVLLLLLVWAAYRFNAPFKRASDRLMLHLPIIGTIMNTSILAFISEYFSLLMASGVDLMKAFRILGSSLWNESYREQIDAIREDLSTGQGISEAFRQCPPVSHFRGAHDHHRRDERLPSGPVEKRLPRPIASGWPSCSRPWVNFSSRSCWWSRGSFSASLSLGCCFPSMTW
jgi:type II secretory pathway component PulF